MSLMNPGADGSGESSPEQAVDSPFPDVRAVEAVTVVVVVVAEALAEVFFPASQDFPLGIPVEWGACVEQPENIYIDPVTVATHLQLRDEFTAKHRALQERIRILISELPVYKTIDGSESHQIHRV